MLRESCKESRDKRIYEEEVEILERERLNKTEEGIIVDVPLRLFITLRELLTSFCLHHQILSSLESEFPFGTDWMHGRQAINIC